MATEHGLSGDFGCVGVADASARRVHPMRHGGLVPVERIELPTFGLQN
jgi:hypothetical protein